jgi:hypothetical protein
MTPEEDLMLYLSHTLYDYLIEIDIREHRRIFLSPPMVRGILSYGGDNWSMSALVPSKEELRVPSSH